MSVNATCENEVWAVLFANQDNTTAMNTLTSSQWVSASNFRGTMDILQSCAFTLVACVYTALHLNVPDKKGWSSQLAEKTKSVVITVLTPEIALVAAAVQLLQAWRFKNAMIDLQMTSKDEAVKKYHVTLTYAFFVAMGGLRVPTSRLTTIMAVGDSRIPDNESSAQGTAVILTTHGTLKLAERGMWLFVSESAIKDKSKANTVQKSLVLCQVSWMLLQCIVRKACGLPLTILEIHTLVHIFCACLMYAFWLKKPLDVIEPEVRFEECWLNVLAVLVQAAFCETPLNENESDEASPDMSGRHVCNENRWARVLEEFKVLVPKYDTPNGLVQAHFGGAIIRSPNMLKLWNKQYSDASGSIPYLFNTGFVFANWDYLVDNPNNVGYFYVLAIISPAMYGGIHMSAWNEVFPTNFEQQNWRACCLLSAFGPVAAYFLSLAVNYLLSLLPESKPEAEVAADSLASKFAFIFTVILATILIIFLSSLQLSYCYARFFIVVESFASLRLVPIGAYWTPMWLQMFPHA